MKDAQGNELHVGDAVLFRRPYSKKWVPCTVRSIIRLTLPIREEALVDNGDPQNPDLRTNGYHLAHTTDEPHRLKKVQTAVDPHETVTKILVSRNEEG